MTTTCARLTESEITRLVTDISVADELSEDVYPTHEAMVISLGVSSFQQEG